MFMYSQTMFQGINNSFFFFIKQEYNSQLHVTTYDPSNYNLAYNVFSASSNVYGVISQQQPAFTISGLDLNLYAYPMTYIKASSVRKDYSAHQPQLLLLTVNIIEESR